MRAIVSVTLAVGFATGCAPGDAHDFRYRATFETRTDGLILHEDGEGGHAGMYGTNCPFDTSTGTVTGDYDLPGEGEDIQDGEPTEIGGITVAAVIPGTVHVLDKTGGEYTHVSVDVGGVSEARLLARGLVALTEDCAVQWVGFEGTVHRSESVADCQNAGFEADPETGSTLLASADGASLFTSTGTLELGLPGDLVAWDATAGAFYVGRRGETRVTAVDLDGAVRWTVDLDGPLGALDDAGGIGAVGVVMELPSGRGLVELRDGFDGEVLKSGQTPSTAEDLAVSGDGSVVALVRPEQAFFFEIL